MSGIDEDRDQEAFVGGLGEALRITGETFSAAGGPLVDGGMARGRRRLRRRRAATVTGSFAALAAVGFGASYAAGAFGVEAGHGSPVAAQPEPGSTTQGKTSTPGEGPQFSASHLIKTLEGLLPDGKFSSESGRGTEDGLGPLASVVFDDGKGKAAIGLSLGRVDPEGTGVAEQLACPAKVYTPYDSCSSKTLADGSRLLLLQGYEYPDKRADTKWWHAYVVTPEGYTVDASEWNAPAEKGEPVSRDEPPLSTGQLKALVTSKEWRPILPGSAEAAGRARAAAGPAGRRRRHHPQEPHLAAAEECQGDDPPERRRLRVRRGERREGGEPRPDQCAAEHVGCGG